MANNPILGPTLDDLTQIWAPKFFGWVLPPLVFRHCCKLSLCTIQRKTNKPNLTKWQKTQFQNQFWSFWPKFGPNIFFSWIFLLLHNRHCCKLSLHAISRKINEPNLRKWQKTYFQDRFWLLWPKFGPRNFFMNFTSTTYQALFQAIIICNFKEN